MTCRVPQTTRLTQFFDTKPSFINHYDYNQQSAA
jgi:hypothetical protein